MPTLRILVTGFLIVAATFAQAPDTATAHRNAAMALVDSNNRGVAHLACPSEAAHNPTEVPAAPGFAGAGRGGSGRGGSGHSAAGRPTQTQKNQEQQQKNDKHNNQSTKAHTSWGVTTSAGIFLIDTLFS